MVDEISKASVNIKLFLFIYIFGLASPPASFRALFYGQNLPVFLVKHHPLHRSRRRIIFCLQIPKNAARKSEALWLPLECIIDPLSTDRCLSGHRKLLPLYFGPDGFLWHESGFGEMASNTLSAK